MHLSIAIIVISLLCNIAPAKAVNIESLNGKKVNATSVSEVKSRKNDNTYTGDFFATYDLSISGNKVNGTIGGYFIFSANRSPTFSENASGVIGTARAGVQNDQFLWSLQGNTLTLRRVFDRYGMVMRVSINGSARCSIQSGIAKQVGGGPVIIPSAYGGTTELLSVKLKSSQCSLRS